jgi:hypothetical protein
MTNVGTVGTAAVYDQHDMLTDHGAR